MSEFTKEDFRATLDQYSKENDIAIHLELHDELIARDAALRLRCEEAEQKYKDVLGGWDASYVVGLETQVADLTAKLGLMTQEQDETRLELSAWKKHGHSKEVQLATAQAEGEQLRLALRYLAEWWE